MTASRAGAAAAAVALAVLVAALASVLIPATSLRRTSGDEPHYLVTAQSLARDGDLDVTNQFAARSYRPFHAPPLGPQGRVLDGGRVVEPHDPLLPALLAAPLAVGGWPSAKATLAVLAAVAAAVVAAALTRCTEAPGRALPAVAALLGTAPFAVYGTQVYPEVPAAVAVAAALAALIGPPSAGRAAAATGAVVALPWLSVKYVPVAAVLALALLAGRLRGGQRQQALAVAGVLAAAGVAYVAAHLAWYGGVTVYAAGGFFAEHGGQASVLGTEPDLVGRASRLVGLLVDRDFGLAAWQPAWLLLVPAVAAWVRRRPPGWGVVACVLAVGWLNATFLAATMHGFWFPGRHLVVVLPAAALVVGWWVAGSRVRTAALAALAAAGAVSYAALLVGAAGGQTSAIFFTGGPDPWRWLWARVLPDYPRGAMVDWVLHGVWITAVMLLAVLGWRRAARCRRAP